MVAAGQGDIARAPQLSLIPAAVLCLTVAALAQLGEALIRPSSPRTIPISMKGVAAGSAAPTTAPAAATSTTRAGLAETGSVIPAPVLEVRGFGTVVHVGAASTEVLQGVTFSVAAGELFGLLGESGSGKSTLARSLVGLAPFGVTATFQGDVRFRGQDLIRHGQPLASASAVRGHGIAHVGQDPATSLDPVMRVGHQVAEMIRRHQRPGNQPSSQQAEPPQQPDPSQAPESSLDHRAGGRRAVLAQTIDLLKAVGLPDAAQLARCYPHELSGGLRQRVAVAVALAANPTLLVADEPTSALDVTTAAALLDLLDRLRQQRDLTVLLISHDLRLLAERADRVAVLHRGRIIEIGPAQDVLEAPVTAYTASLLAAAGPWPPR